jgi:hypothetical protein
MRPVQPGELPAFKVDPVVGQIPEQKYPWQCEP